jgi:hypothetical protein
MATLIPALGTCLHRMTAGEKRLAERLEKKLEDDYLKRNWKTTTCFGTTCPLAPSRRTPTLWCCTRTGAR